MIVETATARTTRELRTAGAIAVGGGVLFVFLPGVPQGCWVNTRLIPAIPLIALGALMVALASRRFRLDRQVDEIAELRRQVAVRHGVPTFAMDDRPGRLKPDSWTKLPFFGLLLGVLALSSAVANTGGCSGQTSAQWGAATGFAVGGLVITVIGLRRYRHAVAEKAALIDRLRAHLDDEAPGDSRF